MTERRPKQRINPPYLCYGTATHRLFFQFGADRRLILTDGQLRPAHVIPLETPQSSAAATAPPHEPPREDHEPPDVFGRLDFVPEIDDPADVCPEQSAFPSLQPNWTFPIDRGGDEGFAPDAPSCSFLPS
jgi:hypothetical protein